MNKSVDGGVDILQICAIDICVDAERADAPGMAAATIASARVLAAKIDRRARARESRRNGKLMAI